MKAPNPTCKVMVVDDSEFVARLIAKMLQDTCFSVVVHAKDGKEAIEKYREHRPDITTMDIIMPQMGGIETISQLLTIDSNARILVISALGHDTIVEEAMKLGATHFLIKPFQRDVFINALNFVWDGSMGAKP
jgi:two-component system, chemotaxis family, chemotaxis protein CheY